MLYIKTADGWKPWLASYKASVNHNQLEGVYRPEPIEKVRNKMSGRIARFLEANGKSLLDKQAHFRGHHFNEPLFGAFGEKL